jgi:hypothetical protein
VRLLAEVEVRRNRVFKKMDEQVTREQKRHRAEHAVTYLLACRPLFCPQNDDFRDDFDKNRRQHEARAERHEVAQEVTAALKSARSGQQKPAPDVGQRHEAPKEEKFAEAHPKIRDRRRLSLIFISLCANIQDMSQVGYGKLKLDYTKSCLKILF